MRALNPAFQLTQSAQTRLGVSRKRAQAEARNARVSVERPQRYRRRHRQPVRRDLRRGSRSFLVRRAAAAGVAGLVCVSAVAVAPSATSSARPRVGKVVAKVPIPAGTGGFAVGEGAVWAVSDAGPTLTRIDPARNAVAASIKIKLTNPCPAEAPGCGEAAAGDGAVWITHVNDDTVSRVDPRTNEVTATIKVGSRPLGIAVSAGAVWVANSGGPTVSRIILRRTG